MADKQEFVRIRRRRLRKLVRIGCTPLTLLVVLAALAFVNLVTYWQAPSWVTNAREYLVTGRYVLSLSILAASQLLGTWLLGLVAASAGTEAVRGSGSLYRVRLAAIRRRVIVLAWAVVILRLLVLLVLLLGAVLVYTPWLGPRLNWSVAIGFEGSLAAGPLLVLAALLVGTLHWIAGPFLRLHYSTALGAWAGTWTSDPAQRRWAASTARLGAGLLGAVALLWGGAVGAFIVARILENRVSTGRSVELFLGWPNFVREALTATLIWLVGTLLYMLGQLLLPRLFGWLTWRTGARRDAPRRVVPLPYPHDERQPPSTSGGG